MVMMVCFFFVFFEYFFFLVRELSFSPSLSRWFIFLLFFGWGGICGIWACFHAREDLAVDLVATNQGE